MTIGRASGKLGVQRQPPAVRVVHVRAGITPQRDCGIPVICSLHSYVDYT